MSKGSTLAKSGSCLITLFILTAIGSLTALFFMYTKVLATDTQLLSLTLVPLILGIIFELKMLRMNWEHVIIAIVVALGSSLFLNILTGDTDQEFDIENYIANYPFVFIVAFLIISIAFLISNKQQGKLTSRLTEGILFVQSISILYLSIDFLDFQDLEILEIILLIIGGLFSIISTFYAFSPLKHTNFSKFLLSFWSSIIMLIFGIFYGIKVFKFAISTEYSLSNNLISFIQYFLFGISAIYTLRNLYFIFGYIPLQHEPTDIWDNRRTEITNIHIDRFSDQQLPILSSIFCLIFVGGIYLLNYEYDWMPSFTMIWLVFTFFPFIIYCWENYVVRNRENLN